MKRGHIITVAVNGDYGKPRPAVVIQSDWLIETESVIICLITSTLREAPIYRLTLHPSEKNGLNATSQIMIDKIMSIKRDKCQKIIGQLDRADIISLNQMLSLITGIAD